MLGSVQGLRDKAGRSWSLAFMFTLSRDVNNLSCNICALVRDGYQVLMVE